MVGRASYAAGELVEVLPGHYTRDGYAGAWFVAGMCGAEDVKLSKHQEDARDGDYEVIIHLRRIKGSYLDCHTRTA